MKILIINKNNHIPITKIKKYTKYIFLTKKNININIKIMQPTQMKKLNKKYKNKNVYTDMLTFRNKTNAKNICDIILCPKIMEKNFEKNYWEIAIIHSALHTINYTHLEKKDAIIMSKIENKLKKLGMSGIEPPTITTSK